MVNKFYQVNSPEVVFDIFDDETIIINMESGNYYSIANVAAKIWEQIGNGSFANEIIIGINNIYEGDKKEIDLTTSKFLDELKNERLIICIDKEVNKSDFRAETPKNNTTNTNKLNFESPEMIRYTDMQDLLVLDPIHEVAESGWPNPLADIPKS